MEIENEMRKFEEELGKFHIPRYEDLPDIELYMDQVVALLNKNLYIIANTLIIYQLHVCINVHSDRICPYMAFFCISLKANSCIFRLNI